MYPSGTLRLTFILPFNEHLYCNMVPVCRMCQFKLGVKVQREVYSSTVLFNSITS